MRNGSASTTPVDTQWTDEGSWREGPDEYICWSRMQAEAGQPLESIVSRKEAERRAGDGLFFWGVGNAPAVMISALARLNRRIPVVFSVMKSRPKAIDIAPNRTFAWRSYIDAFGAERPLPPHVIVTSRGDSAGGAKRAHYALMCHSDDPLVIVRGKGFDPTAFRNAGGTGAPVGPSQVTALLKRIGTDRISAEYEANITAWLTGSYWVRLTDPVELDAARLAIVSSAAEGGVEELRRATTAVRSGPPANGSLEARGALL